MVNVEFDKVPDRQGSREGPHAKMRQVGRSCRRAGLIAPALGVLFDGFAYGMLLFLLSVGLSVTLGMMNFVNLAHGAFAMLGAYVTVTLMDRRLAVPRHPALRVPCLRA